MTLQEIKDYLDRNPEAHVYVEKQLGYARPLVFRLELWETLKECFEGITNIAAYIDCDGDILIQ